MATTLNRSDMKDFIDKATKLSETLNNAVKKKKLMQVLALVKIEYDSGATSIKIDFK